MKEFIFYMQFSERISIHEPTRLIKRKITIEADSFSQARDLAWGQNPDAISLSTI